MRKRTVSRKRERYAQTVLTFRITYLPASLRPVSHSADLPVAKPPTNMTLSDSEPSNEDAGQAYNNNDCDPAFA